MEPNKTAPPRNRRLAMRKTPRTFVKVECRRGGCGLGKSLAAQFLDLSEGGVRIVVTEALDANEEVEVLFTSVNQRKPNKRLANVCWSLPLENGQFCVGLEFQKRLPFQDVSQLGRP